MEFGFFFAFFAPSAYDLLSWNGSPPSLHPVGGGDGEGLAVGWHRHRNTNETSPKRARAEMSPAKVPSLQTRQGGGRRHIRPSILFSPTFALAARNIKWHPPLSSPTPLFLLYFRLKKNNRTRRLWKVGVGWFLCGKKGQCFLGKNYVFLQKDFILLGLFRISRRRRRRQQTSNGLHPVFPRRKIGGAFPLTSLLRSSCLRFHPSSSSSTSKGTFHSFYCAGPSSRRDSKSGLLHSV